MQRCRKHQNRVSGLVPAEFRRRCCRHCHLARSFSQKNISLSRPATGHRTRHRAWPDVACLHGTCTSVRRDAVPSLDIWVLENVGIQVLGLCVLHISPFTRAPQPAQAGSAGPIACKRDSNALHLGPTLSQVTFSCPSFHPHRRPGLQHRRDFRNGGGFYQF